MIVVCVGGPHEGHSLDVPDNSVRLEFADARPGEGYYILGAQAHFKLGHFDESEEAARRRLAT